MADKGIVSKVEKTEDEMEENSSEDCRSKIMTRGNDYTSEKDVALLFAQQGERCSVRTCRKEIHLQKPRDFIIEHENQLSISKDNSLKNKTLRCLDCASKKTNGTKATSYGSDTHARAKIDRLLGLTCTKPSREINSRGFEGSRPMSRPHYDNTKRLEET